MMKVRVIKTRKAFMRNYNYLLINDETHEAVLIDASWEPLKIKAVLEEENAVLCGILFTHAHFDHVNIIDELLDDFDVPVFISREESEFYDFRCPNLVLLERNQDLNICSTVIHSLFLPGHTVGSVAYYTDEHYFVGDVLLIEGCALLDDEGADVHNLFMSVRMLFDFIPDDAFVYPGHASKNKPGITMKDLKEINVYTEVYEEKAFSELSGWNSTLKVIS